MNPPFAASPYGLKSMMECLSRATLLSQPEDIPDFLTKYMSGLINFRDSGHETDPKLLCFQYQEQWEKTFFRRILRGTETSETSTASSNLPSQAALKETLRMLTSYLASSKDDSEGEKSADPESDVCTDVKPPMTVKTRRVSTVSIPCHKESATVKTSEDQKPFPKPTPPPRGVRQFGKMAPPPSLVVKVDAKPAPPPCDESKKTRRVSTVRFARPQDSKTTTETSETHQPTSSTSKHVPAPQSRVSKKPPAPIPPKPVPPAAPEKKLAVRPKSTKESTRKRDVSERTSTEPATSRPKPTASSASGPDHTSEPRAQRPKSSRAQVRTHRKEEPEKTRAHSTSTRATGPEETRIKKTKTFKDMKQEKTRTQLKSSKDREVKRTSTTTVPGPQKTRTHTTTPQDKEAEGTKTRPSTPRVLKPDKTKTRPTTSKIPQTKKTKTQSTTAKAQGQEKGVEWDSSPGKTKSSRVLWSERARARPIVNRGFDFSHTFAFSRQGYGPYGLNSLDLGEITYTSHMCPHVARPVNMIRWNRLRAECRSVHHNMPSGLYFRYGL
ncbi:proteoglycan 4-like isoform X1 [Anabas testudineus]|uniref:proteoglycan 4-like isoform X1 n=1 Tax=Anabas testudineus TaxID=64144 RepID=UPI00143CCC00|nr:proteoglycan 4-like isoform X1 [Anabas testudineus]